MNDSAIPQLLKAFNKFTMQQKIIVGGALIVSIIIFAVLFLFLNEPDYSALYSNLSETDASKVITYLNSQKISYELTDNGKTIKVPKDKLYEVRYSLAEKGIPNSGITGYEIFDETTMGMSEFTQQLNFKRALEGELARTIMQQDGIEGARVMIVLPRNSVFRNDNQPPKASVVVKLSGGYSFSVNKTNAILNLVANSVEGLTPQNVTLIDTQGRLLSKNMDETREGSISSKQYEIKQTVEKYLSNKVQSILDQVIGYANSTVQVNAEFNFDRVEKTMETFDPESQVAISEQNVKNQNSGSTITDSSLESSQSNTTNYEINRTVEKVIQGSGNVKHLSVAVVVNDIRKEIQTSDVVETVYEPRTPQQIQKLENIIKNAVGIDLERGDRISLVNIQFENNNMGELEITEPGGTNSMDKIIDLVLIIAAIVGAIILLKGIMSKIKNEKFIHNAVEPERRINQQFRVPQAAPAVNNFQNNISYKRNRELFDPGDLEDEITDEAMIKKSQQDKIGSYVSKNPEDAARLINTWLHEDEFQE
jgi:flagellar M-ring protein FliF